MEDLNKVYPNQLSEELYNLDDEEKAFFQTQTKINDDEALKQHILAVQRKAYTARLDNLLTESGFPYSRLSL